MSLEMNANLTKMYDFAKTAIGHEALSGEDSVIQTRRNAPGLVGRKWTKLGGPKCTYGLREVHRCIFKSALGGGLRKLRLDHHPYMDKGFGDACLDEDPRRFHRNRPTTRIPVFHCQGNKAQLCMQKNHSYTQKAK